MYGKVETDESPFSNIRTTPRGGHNLITSLIQLADHGSTFYTFNINLQS